jgi:hypothetical protein
LKLDDTVFFLGLCPLYNFVKKHIILEGSIVVDGTGDMLWNDSEEEGDGRSESEENGGAVCEAGDTGTDW